MTNNSQSSSDLPKISIVTPSYNQGEFIEATIDSILSQNYPNLEYIIIDGGSTDNSVAIIKKYEKYLHYWCSEPDNGQADAINKGFNLSSGDILCWLNSDDMYLPRTLIDIGNKFKGRIDQSLLIYGGCIMLNQIGDKITCCADNSDQNAQSYSTYFNRMIQPSSFWTRSLWEKAGMLEIQYNYVLDWEWFMRASNIGIFEYVPKVYSIYRIHAQHKTSYGGKKKQQEILNIVNKHASDYWKNLYNEVDKNAISINKKIDNLKQMPDQFRRLIIYKKKLFNFFFPELQDKLDDIEDLYKVLNTLKYE